MPENQEQQAEWSQQGVEKQAEALQTEQTQQAETQQAEGDEVKEKVERVVPHGAFHAEREERKKAQAQARAFENQLNQERQQYLMHLAQRQQAQAPQPPKFEEAPLENLKHGIDTTAQQLANIQQHQARQQWEQQQRAQFEQFTNTVRSQADSYIREQPEAGEAIKFLKHGRYQEYKGMGMDEQAAVQRVLQDELDLSAWALERGENPAKVAHEMAVARGYKDSKQKLEMQRQGQGASLPTGGGRSGGLPSLEALLKMDSKDFAKATAGDNWAKLLQKHS